MKIFQSSLIGVAISLIVAFPAKGSFPCQEFYSAQPELTLDQLLGKAEFVGMYMAKSATKTDRRIDGGMDYLYEYKMIQTSQFMGDHKLSFTAVGLPPYQQPPQHYFAMIEFHSQITEDNVTEYGMSQPVRDDVGRECFFAPRMVVGYSYLVIGGVDSQISYEMIPITALDDWYKMVRDAVRNRDEK